MKPEPMTDEQMLCELKALDADTKRLPPGFKAYAQAISYLRDKQWEELLSKQEPIIGLQAVHDAITVNSSLAEEPGAAEEEDAYRRHKCMCGEPWRLDTVHRSKSPCFDYIEHQWVGLTNEEREEIAEDYGLELSGYRSAFKEVEAKLRGKNQ